MVNVSASENDSLLAWSNKFNVSPCKSGLLKLSFIHSFRCSPYSLLSINLIVFFGVTPQHRSISCLTLAQTASFGSLTEIKGRNSTRVSFPLVHTGPLVFPLISYSLPSSTYGLIPIRSFGSNVHSFLHESFASVGTVGLYARCLRLRNRSVTGAGIESMPW